MLRTGVHECQRCFYIDGMTPEAIHTPEVVRSVASARARPHARRHQPHNLTKDGMTRKRLSPRHLVAVGSEGTTPFESYINVGFDETHALAEIDVITIHVWAQNWDWGDASGKERFESALRHACAASCLRGTSR